MKEYRIDPCTGVAIDVAKGEYITVIDVDGGQVADFFAEVQGRADEFLSVGATMDCNESLRLAVGDILYTNKYAPMFKVIADDVGEHDLIHPCCRPEMFAFFYRSEEGHPNCLDNINRALAKRYPVIHPVNLFMHTKIAPDGKFAVLPPKSKAGDRIVFRAETDVRLGVAACSVSESDCNSGRCTAIQIIVSKSI